MTSVTGERARAQDLRVVEPWRTSAAMVAWAAVVSVAFVWGQLAIADDPRQVVRAAPLVGRWAWHGTLALVPAVGFGVAVAMLGPAVAARVRWRRVPVLAGACAAAWAALLAVSDGWGRLARPLVSRYEYVPFAAQIDDPSTFVSTFTERALDYPTHVRGHPPGATLAFWALDRLGLAGAGWAAVLVVAAWGVAVGVTVVAVGSVAGRPAARAAAPFLVLLPAVVWAGTSADALFAGCAALGVTLLVVATSRRTTWLAISGGAVLGLALHVTYGVVPLLAVPAAVIVWRRRVDVALGAAAGVLVVSALWVVAGFWWLDGLDVTRAAYSAGVASDRPWPYYALAGNPAALALATGPAISFAAAHARREQTAWWVLAAASAAGVAVANASGLSKGEVERIWLLFVPWLATVAALVPRLQHRRWLLAQVGVSVALQAWLRSPW